LPLQVRRLLPGICEQDAEMDRNTEGGNRIRSREVVLCAVKRLI
jgi:hypothetical protein